MRAACTSPGSRCAPLVLSLTHEPRLRCYSHVDERSSGFFALGLAKASGLPVAVACTSGTAAAELLPAAIEAQQARVPLLLLSADRAPYVRREPSRLSAPGSMARLYELARAAKRGLVVAGRDERGGPPPIGPADPRSVGEAAAAFGAAAGWPVLADPLSGARRGGA